MTQVCLKCVSMELQWEMLVEELKEQADYITERIERDGIKKLTTFLRLYKFIFLSNMDFLYKALTYELVSANIIVS